MCFMKHQNKSQCLVHFNLTSVYWAPTRCRGRQSGWWKVPRARIKHTGICLQRECIWSVWRDPHWEVTLICEFWKVILLWVWRMDATGGEAGYREGAGDTLPQRKSQFGKALIILSSEQFPRLKILFTWDTAHFSSTGGNGGLFSDSPLRLAGALWLELWGFVAMQQWRWEASSQPHTLCAQKALHEAVGLPRKHAEMGFSNFCHLATISGSTVTDNHWVYIQDTFQSPHSVLQTGAHKGRGAAREERWARSHRKSPDREKRLSWTTNIEATVLNTKFHHSPCQLINCGRLSCWWFHLKDWSSFSRGGDSAGVCKVVHGAANKNGLCLCLLICHNLLKCLP